MPFLSPMSHLPHSKGASAEARSPEPCPGAPGLLLCLCRALLLIFSCTQRPSCFASLWPDPVALLPTQGELSSYQGSLAAVEGSKDPGLRALLSSHQENTGIPLPPDRLPATPPSRTRQQGVPGITLPEHIAPAAASQGCGAVSSSSSPCRFRKHHRR